MKLRAKIFDKTVGTTQNFFIFFYTSKYTYCIII